MKAEIKYTFGACHGEDVNECDGFGCSHCLHRFERHDIEKGFSEEIREYSIENTGDEAYIDIVVNRKKKINLCLDLYGIEPEDGYVNRFDDCEYFVVDGQVLWGEKPEVTDED